jgi:hypothetical protein
VKSSVTSSGTIRVTNASEVRVKCSYDARVSRICCANVTRMPRECCADVVRIPRRCHAYVVQMRRASYARHSRSKCDVKRAGSAHHTRCTRREKCATWHGLLLVSTVLERYRPARQSRDWNPSRSAHVSLVAEGILQYLSDSCNKLLCSS